MEFRAFFVAAALLVTAAAVATLVSITLAMSHEAPTGWQYPWECCSGVDCRQISASFIKETPEGYQIPTSGEIIPYDSGKIKDSPDGLWHWCSRRGGADTPTICLYVPARMF